MKLFLLIFAFVAFSFVFQPNTLAQKYYTYDGDTFSVLLTTNSDDGRIIKVEFSSNNEWHKFDIVDFEDYEDTSKGGFQYIVLDGKNRKFIIDYYRYNDYIIVKDASTNEEWKLIRRKD